MANPFSLDDPQPAAGTTATLTIDADLNCDLSGLDDDQLVALGALVAAEQQERAVANADPDALVELGFTEGFRSNGLPVDPWLVGGVLVCPGARVDKSTTTHDCGFVSIDSTWIWECPDLLVDVVRQIPGPKPQMRSVSLVPVYEGLEVDLVVSKMRSGVHQMQSVRSFVVRSGHLELVQARARKADHGR